IPPAQPRPAPPGEAPAAADDFPAIDHSAGEPRGHAAKGSDASKTPRDSHLSALPDLIHVPNCAVRQFASRRTDCIIVRAEFDIREHDSAPADEHDADGNGATLVSGMLDKR